MFSYRHSFHAGNHADVLKHTILIHILDHLGLKPTPYWVVDTHAGAGCYDLTSAWARKNAEAAQGIGQLWERTDLPPLLARYITCVRLYNSDGQLRYYPGSPWLALQAMRPHDRLQLFEQHPSEVKVLNHHLQQRGRLAQRQTRVFSTDGFEGVKALLPPPPRRGLVLIDPSYEDKRDYHRVLIALKEGLKRFATGTYMIWYPQVQRRESQAFPRQILRLPLKNWTHVTLTVKAPSRDGLGLHGSGVIIINPPWTLYDQLKQALPYLHAHCAQDAKARFMLEATPP